MSDSPAPSAHIPLPCGEGAGGGFWLALLSAIAVALGVTPELSIDSPDLNDSAYHVALALRADEALQRGESPIDFWYPDVALGSPLFRHYQHLPHLFLVALHRMTGGFVLIPTLYRIILGFLLTAFPLALYLALRRFGLPSLTAGCAALLAPLVSTPHLYGLGLESYVWGGSGLYAQAFASVLMPLALAESYRAVRGGRGLALAAVLLAATFLSQLIYGYMAALSTVVFVVPRGQRLRKAMRLVVLLGVTFLIASYFFVPALRDAEFANHSVWEKPEKWNSLGASAVLGHLVTGRLFDQGRGPVLTILLAVGLVYALWRGNEPLRLLAGLFVAWVLLYFGRPAWGRLIDLLPMARDIPLHRLIGAVHLFGLALAGVGLAFLLRAVAGKTPAKWRIAAAVGVAAVVIAWPAYERFHYLQNSRLWKSQSAAAIAADADLRPLLAELHKLPGGRVYAGIPGRSAEYLRVGGVPLSAFCLVEGIDTLGFLWIPITYASDVQVWFDPDNEVQCQTFGVKYLVFDSGRKPPAFAKLLRAVGKYRVYEVDSAGYFRLGEVPFAIPCTKRTVYDIGHAWVQSWLPRLNVYPALAIAGRTSGNLPQQTLDPKNPVRSLNSRARPFLLPSSTLHALDPWTCAVDLQQPAALVRAGSYHPGIRASVDGAAATVLAVTPGFAAVQLPAGRHEVKFWYDPGARWPWFIIGFVAFLGAALGNRLAKKMSFFLPSQVQPGNNLHI